MRKSRFARSDLTGSSSDIGWLDALSFDVSPTTNADEEAIANQRLVQLKHVPVLLAFSHFVSLTVFAIYVFARGATYIPASLWIVASVVLLLDAASLMVMRFAEKKEASPRRTTMAMCALLALVTATWAAFGYIAGSLDLAAEAPIIPIIIGGGMVACAIAVIGAPPLSVTCALAGTLAAALFQVNPIITAGVASLSMVLVAYSVMMARSMIADAWQRIRLDHDAHKALQFVREFENSGHGWFWETTAEGTLSYVSQQLADDFECQPEELVGRQFTDLLSVDKSEDATFREERTLGFHLSARFPFSDVVVQAAVNEDIHWSLSGNPLFDHNGRFMGFRGIGTDLTEQRRSEQEISRLARFDSLTGLPNRALMRQTLDEALRNATRRQKGCALFLIDLDRFKNVNDTLGHPVGDALLKQVAERLKSVMGNNGQVGRLGGDEFKAVLPGVVETGLLESLAKTLIEQVSRPYVIEGHKISIGASVGIAIGDPGRACADALVRNADLALYAAKAAGRGVHCFYESSMHSEATDRQALENDLRHAIDRDELSVVFQPIVRTTGETVCGFESLIRWTHPVRGNIGPDRFIPLAEECGMIEKIGEFLLDLACAEAVKWPDKVRVAVNLSPIQFNNPAIVRTVAAALEKHKLRPDRLELEITEGVFLADSDETDQTFEKLKSLGVRLALDDFGTGYSSLGYLRKAPFDKIKIDQGFVRGASSTGNRNAAIIRAIVSLADSLGMDTTAEGVETHDDLQLIRDLGVSQVQGYIFGRPASPADALKLAASANVEADGYDHVRDPRQSIMRRAVTMLEGFPVDIRLRNVSSSGALIECDTPVSPGTRLTIDIVGVGPVVGTVRWAHSKKFGMQFEREFDLRRLAPKARQPSQNTVLRPSYFDEIDKREAS